MGAAAHPARWKTLGAFAIIYFVWGSTFLAIRIGVHEVPPFLLAAIRFTIAGALLLGFAIARRERLPTARQWASATLLGFMIFVCDYGLLFWAEQRVPSGIAAVVLATIPAFMAISEIAILRTQKLTLRLVIALLIGICGVAVLVNRSLNLGGDVIDRTGAAALIFAAIGWSIAASLTRKLPLPESKAVSSGAQMLTGGVLLAIASAAFGEMRGFRPAAVSAAAWWSLAYLVVAGSIVGFTAYLWLLHHESPTKVGTYAYVNPAVAVVIGYFFGGESLGARTILGTLLVLLSVVVITTAKTRQPVPELAAEEAG